MKHGTTPKLVGGFNPSENMLVKLDHFPKVPGENIKYLKPPPRKPIQCSRVWGILSQGCIFFCQYHGSFGHVSSRKVYHIVAAGSRVASKAVQAVKTLHGLDALVFQSYLQPGGVLDLFLGPVIPHKDVWTLLGMFKKKALKSKKNGPSIRDPTPKKGGWVTFGGKQESYEFQQKHLRVAPRPSSPPA